MNPIRKQAYNYTTQCKIILSTHSARLY
uniref:Uncharacterized protein n=1 Tax=Arundo donax TaxID=35708 RepID=A0A0A9AM48_ARUDO